MHQLSNLSKNYLAQEAQGTANQASITQQSIGGELLVCLPPLAEQRRIVAKVEQLMALVDALETQLAASRAPPRTSSPPSSPNSPRVITSLYFGQPRNELCLEDENTSQPPNPLFRILSLDGGGAKGFYTLGVLKEIEALTACPLCDKFSLIFGTSTGAILAALLALGRTVDEAHKTTENMSRE